MAKAFYRRKTWNFRYDPCSMQVYLLLLMSPLRRFFRPVSDEDAGRHYMCGCSTWEALCEHSAQWAHDNADGEGWTTLESARVEIQHWLHTCLGIQWGEFYVL